MNRTRLALGLVAAATLSACTSTGSSAGGPPPGTTTTAPSSPTVTSTVAIPTTRGVPACRAASVIAAWPVSRRAAQLVAVPALSANPTVVQAAVSSGAGGVLLIGPMPSAATLAADVRSATAARGPGRVAPFVMVDQEGGEVQRLGADVESLPWPRTMAQTMTTAEVEQKAAILGREMLSLGVGVDLAPVLDLDGGPALSTTDPDGPRSFSTDPATAASYGAAFARGLQRGGVLPVFKHFPGLGRATGNTDYGPAATRPIGDLQASGLKPFESAVASGAKAVMVSNASVPGLTGLPASLSSRVITGLLRGQLHFGGLVMTDSLSAGAVSSAGYDIVSGSVASIEAGTDMVLFGSTLTEAQTRALAPSSVAAEMASIVSALTGAVARGALPESRLDDAVEHVVQAKGVDLCAA